MRNLPLFLSLRKRMYPPSPLPPLYVRGCYGLCGGIMLPWVGIALGSFTHYTGSKDGLFINAFRIR